MSSLRMAAQIEKYCRTSPATMPYGCDTGKEAGRMGAFLLLANALPRAARVKAIRINLVMAGWTKSFASINGHQNWYPLIADIVVTLCRR